MVPVSHVISVNVVILHLHKIQFGAVDPMVVNAHPMVVKAHPMVVNAHPMVAKAELMVAELS